MGEMLITSKELCDSCKYSKVWLTRAEKPMCDYLCMTLKRRNCPIGKCDKYEKRVGAE